MVNIRCFISLFNNGNIFNVIEMYVIIFYKRDKVPI